MSWKIRSVKNNIDKPSVVFLDIEGKRDTLKFEIGPGYSMLRIKEFPELAHLLNKKMPVGTLLY